MVPLVSLSLGLHGGIDRGVSWIHQLVVHLFAGKAVSMEQSVEIPNNLGLEVGSADYLARNHALHGLADFSNNSGELSRKDFSGALKIFNCDV